MINTEKIERIPNKIKRTVIKFPALQVLSKLAYKQEIEKHKSYLPKISPANLTLVNSLCQKGAFVTSLQALELPNTPLLIAAAKKSLPELLAVPSNEKHAISLTLSKLMNYPEIFLWGLQEQLLDVIENYIGLSVLYHGADFRREIANNKLIDVRQWHIDVEDYRMIKIIVYLNDVDLNGGPFEYISKHLTSSVCKILKYNSGFVSDRVMETVVPASAWKPCTGCSGTVIFADTCNIFHRAKPPILSDRFSITFSYTSRQPITNYSKVALLKDELLAISSRLSNRQRECLL